MCQVNEWELLLDDCPSARTSKTAGNHCRVKHTFQTIVRKIPSIYINFTWWNIFLLMTHESWGFFQVHWCTAIKPSYKARAWPYCGANRISKFSSLALLRCKLTFQIFDLDFIAVQIEIQNFKLGLFAVQIEILNFRARPYCGTNRNSKFFSLALLRCKSIFRIFGLGLIAMQTDIQNFVTWPYCGANRLGLIVVHQLILNKGSQRSFEIFSR